MTTFTRYGFSSFKTKSEASKRFKVFKEFSERLNGHPIKVLYLDCGRF
jgi:hypothetical protein